jgi:hypothetical protein
MSRIVAVERYPVSAKPTVAGRWSGSMIRASTTAVTAVAAGRLCFPVASLEAAVPLAARLDNPLLVGELVKHWGDAPDDAFLGGRSVEYLEATGQMHDADFILGHVDDLDCTFELRAGEVVHTEHGRSG